MIGQNVAGPAAGVHPAADCSSDLYDDAGTGVRDVHVLGAAPEQHKARREVTVDRAGDRQGALGVGVPAADAGETGQGALVSAVLPDPRASS